MPRNPNPTRNTRTIDVHGPLYDLIRRKNMTVQDFAHAAGVSYATADNTARAVRPIGPKLMKFLESEGEDVMAMLKRHETAMIERKRQARAKFRGTFVQPRP